MVIEQKSQRIVERVLDPRGQERLDVMSVTKAIAGLLTGIMSDRDGINGDETIDNYIRAKKEICTRVNINHILTHSSALRLPEDDQVGQLYAADDFSLIFDHAHLLFIPGTRTAYSNLAVNIMSLLIQGKTGLTMSAYANCMLFRPLNMSAPFWESDKVGHSFAMAGLHLTANEMAKLSVLLLSRGFYEGRAIVPAAWVDSLWRGSSFVIEDSVGGRASWQNLWAQTYYNAPTLDETTRLPVTPPDMVSANGYGGQFIIVLRKSQLRIVTQRDMDLHDDGATPQLGGPTFLTTLQRLDEVFALE